MNVDPFHNDFYHLLLVATATIAGTFHSPATLHTPIPAETITQTNTRYATQQQIQPPQKTNKTAPPISSTPKSVSLSQASPTSVPTTRPSKTLAPTVIKSQNSTVTQPTPTEKKQEIVLNIPSAETPVPKRSLNPDILLQLINTHREGLQLPPLVKDEQLCKLAEYRKPQLYDEIFTNGNVHKGLYDLNLPYYITENMAHYSTEQAILNWWLGSYIHKAAIEGNNKYSCGACSGDSCAQLFTNYTPKS